MTECALSNIDLYFAAMMKDGNVLFAAQGPFMNEEQASAATTALNFTDNGGRCYYQVVKVRLPCEVVEQEAL
jgi:hypothetical protein